MFGGCFTTVPVDVYMPQSGAELVDDLCPSGPPHTLRIALPSQVELLITVMPETVYPATYEHLSLYIRLRVPAGATARFAGSDIVLTSAAWPEPRAATILRIVDVDANYLGYSPLAELPGTRRSGKYIGYVLSFTSSGPREATTIPAIDSFTMRLPSLLIDGQETSIPDVAYAKETLHGPRLVCD